MTLAKSISSIINVFKKPQLSIPMALCHQYKSHIFMPHCHEYLKIVITTSKL